MQAEFLPPEELGRLREGWFEIVEKVESLQGYSRNHATLAEELTSLTELADSWLNCLELVCESAGRLMPEKQSLFERLCGELSSAFERFRSAVERDCEELRLYRELTERLEREEERLRAEEKRRRELEAEMRAVCGEAEHLRQMFEKRVEKLRDATDRRLGEVRDAFVAEARRLLQARRVYDPAGEELPLEVLFERMISHPHYELEIEFSGASGAEDAGLRHELRVLASDGMKSISALLEEERRRIDELEEGRRAEYAEEACKRLRKKVEESIMGGKAIMARVEELKLRTAALKEKFGSSGALLTLQKSYLSMLNTAAEPRRRLFLALEESPAEPVQRKEGERDELVREISELRAELERRLGELQELRRKNSELFSALSEAEQRTAELEREKRALGAELEQLGAEISELRDVREQLSGEKAALEAELEKERKKSAELQEELSKLREEVEKALRDREEVISSLKAELGRMRAERAVMESSLNKTLEKERELRSGAEGRLRALEKEIAELRDHLSSLEDERELLAGEVKRLRRLLEARGKGSRRVRSGRDEAYVGEKIDALRRRK